MSRYYIKVYRDVDNNYCCSIFTEWSDEQGNSYRNYIYSNTSKTKEDAEYYLNEFFKDIVSAVQCARDKLLTENE